MYEHTALEILSVREVDIPIQQITRRKWLNDLQRALIFDPIERIALDMRRVPVMEYVFRSPIETDIAENNVGHVRHYRGSGERSVILLPQKSRGYNFAQCLAQYFASAGIDAWEVETPLRGSRLPAGIVDVGQLPFSAERLHDTVDQAVQEARGIADLVPGQVGICGISLGAIYASIAYGIDQRFDAGCLLLGGGDLSGMVQSSHDSLATNIRKHVMENGYTQQEIDATFAAIEPCNYTDHERTHGLMLVNAASDRIIPRHHGNMLWESWGRPRRYVLGGGHLSVARRALEMFPKIRQHFMSGAPCN